MSTLKITQGEPIKAATPGAAGSLALFLFSDQERNVSGCIHLDAVAKLGELIEHDFVGAEREATALKIGECVAVLLCIAAKLTVDTNGLMPAMKWQHRGPDAGLREVAAVKTRLAENMGRIAKNTRAAILATNDQVKRPPAMALVQYCGSTVHSGDGLDLYTYASAAGLSLRECFEAFAETRRAKLGKNAKRYGREVPAGEGEGV